MTKYTMKELEESCDVMFCEQRADPFGEKRDCTETLLEVDPLEEFDEECEDGVHEMLRAELECPSEQDGTQVKAEGLNRRRMWTDAITRAGCSPK